MSSPNDESSDFPPPPWEMVEFEFHVSETDAILVTHCNGHRVVIDAHQGHFSGSPALKEKYLFFLQVAENFELDGYTVEDMYDWMAEPLLPFFEKLVKLPTFPNTLDTFFSPEVFYFTLGSKKDALIATPSEKKEHHGRLFGISVPDDAIYKAWPCYKPAQIRLSHHFMPNQPPSSSPGKVELPNGGVAFLKLIRPGDRGSFIHELKKYKEIHLAQLQHLRISRLLGLVRDEEGLVLGLLLLYVDCAYKTLFCAGGPKAKESSKKKWAAQVSDTLQKLHHAGIIWGDAKPDNVLIDKNGDAWLIDFCGSYTEGWAPKELAGTADGDLVGIGKIKEFLKVE